MTDVDSSSSSESENFDVKDAREWVSEKVEELKITDKHLNFNFKESRTGHERENPKG